MLYNIYAFYSMCFGLHELKDYDFYLFNFFSKQHFAIFNQIWLKVSEVKEI